ncbi:MAG: hypothetical protein IPO70_06785 [Bacteroidetes bacterium]|nr:hypothetical protein [Bacteroidota bacterium]
MVGILRPIKRKIEVHEYSLEDFEDGSLGYNVRVGKILERNSKTGEFNYYLLPEDEAKKIAARRREYYFEKVELRYSAFKYQFDTKLSKSENCKKLFETEIKSLEESLDNNKLYKKIIVEGERNFNLTNSPNCQISTAGNDRDYINIEAQSKFLKYLKLLFKK